MNMFLIRTIKDFFREKDIDKSNSGKPPKRWVYSMGMMKRVIIYWPRTSVETSRTKELIIILQRNTLRAVVEKKNR